MQEVDVVIVGGGIIGIAAAMAIVERGDRSVTVLEAEPALAAHQSGRNSGVIHAGLYYPPGSDKAQLCAEGREQMYDFCRTHDIAHEQCGKLVLATSEDEIERLDALEQRATDNGLTGIRRVQGDDIRAIEPNARGVDALWIPHTGIVDFAEVTRAMARIVEQHGGTILKDARVRSIKETKDAIVVEHERGLIRCRFLIACAGLHADRVARMCKLDPGCAIIPFRGEYCELIEERRHLVRNLIYPVPDPALPFLGVHFTRTIQGAVELGPNAVLALSRKGYRRSSINPADLAGTLTYPGFWRMAATHFRAGMSEMHRSWSKRAFVRDARRMIPNLQPADVRPSRSGIRAQAVDPAGALMKDFHFVESGRMIHVLNAPSPAATASIAIGKRIADRIESNGRLHEQISPGESLA